MTRPPAGGTLACVMGGMNLIRPLGLAGIACAVVAPPGDVARRSRFVRAHLPWADCTERQEDLADMLVRFGSAQASPPVLYCEEDTRLLFVSRNRERLSQAFRFVLPDRALVEDLVDKARFQGLAERLGLPVPPTRRIRPVPGSAPEDPGLRFPVVVKPVMRRTSWDAVWGERKALRAADMPMLRTLWPDLAMVGTELLVQEMVPGPETRIESYHVYADRDGGIAGEFTGRKVRTRPPSCGHSTAVEITEAPDVAELGRALVRKLGLRGVAKFDFKRDPRGRLHLLEVNPRFNLWHHPGALAGVNLPAIVHADMTGRPRPPARPARAGVRWCTLPGDLSAARAGGVSLASWLAWAAGCEAKSNAAWDDPVPLLDGVWQRLVSRYGGRPARPGPPVAGVEA